MVPAFSNQHSKRVIKLFVSDIDGCLSEPYRPFDAARLQTLAACAAEGGTPHDRGAAPAFSLCSGRAYPYVEAMTQVLGLRVPVLFEAGGGCFDPVAARVRWHPDFTDEVAAQIEQARRWLQRECLPGTALMYDFSKRTQAGIAGADAEALTALRPVIERYVAANLPALCVFHTDVSIDVLPAGVTKRQGMAWLAEIVGCGLEEMAFVGDTLGDLEALRAVGFSFAPANATEAVRRQVQTVTKGRVAAGVLEAFAWCHAYNRRLLKKAS